MPSLQPEPELRALFARRRKRQFLMVFPVAIAMVMFHFLDADSQLSGLASTGLIIGAMAAVLGAVGFSVWNWRCPSCDGYLGRSINPRHCASCGFRLQE